MIKLLNEDKYHTLFAIHEINGSIYHYRSLAKKLKGICSLYGIDNTSLFFQLQDDYLSIPQLAEKYVTEIRKISLTEPYYFFAHCVGSFFAYEVCKQIETNGGKIGALFLVDPPAANFIQQDNTLGLSPIFSSFCGADGIDIKKSEICGFSYLESLDYIMAKVKKIFSNNSAALVDDIDYGNIERVIRVHLSNLLAFENYEVCSKVKNIIIIRPENSGEKLERVLSTWQGVCNTNLRVKYLLGNSSAIFQEPLIDSITEIIKVNVGER